MSKKIIVFGSVNQDFYNYVEQFPRPGESVRGLSFTLGYGGKGANQAVATAKLGGEVGDDIFGDMNIEQLKNANVKTELIKRLENTATGCATITIDRKGENSIIITNGANGKLTPQFAQKFSNIITNSALVLCQNEVPEVANLEIFKLARKHGVKTFLNSAPGNADIDHTIFKYTDVLCTNEIETECIVKRSLKEINEFKEAAKEMVNLGPDLVVITIGKKGAVVAGKVKDKIKVDHIQLSKVDVVDTTGAGDCFCGSLAYLLVNKLNLCFVEAVDKAVKIATLSVTRRGSQSSYFNLDELKQHGVHI